MCIVICTLLLSRPARGAWVEIQKMSSRYLVVSSRPARGAWVEIRKGLYGRSRLHGRAPQGARGLKFRVLQRLVIDTASRPARGAWVEMEIRFLSNALKRRRAPQGARGLKYKLINTKADKESRAPQGARGLKCLRPWILIKRFASRPARGAWVEIIKNVSPNQSIIVAPRKGRVG